MSDVLRIKGTKVVTVKGDTTVAAPIGSVFLDAPLTYVLGNERIAHELRVDGDTTIYSGSGSNSTQTGALRVTGGVGISQNVNIGGILSVTGTVETLVIKPNDDNVENPYGIPFESSTTYGTSIIAEALNISLPAAKLLADQERQQAAVFIGGGLGIEKDLNVGGYIYGRIAEASTSLNLVLNSTNIDDSYYPIFSKVSSGFSPLYTDVLDESSNPGGLVYNPYQGKLTLERVSVVSTDTSTSPTTGAFTVTGGVGILGDVHIGGAEYVDNLYTKIIESTTGPIQIKPESAVTEIVGDIRVLGQRPIGTAPVVTNTLYVTMDGDDTNDGRAQDPSRACRTIGAALKSPYYQPGTQIKVSPGHYLEDNPLQLKPYTSIMGSDIRTTSIEPINKTQDLFHMNSGCYLAFMQFLNGRSGLLEGPYAPKYNRGAYCTAFPPLEGEDRIDLFHSPYIQNCTNLSGPWLKDGTMFVPDQTVQVPLAVGTGTWEANTTSIIVNVSTGTIVQGMYINPGQQNPGFFNARTLLLANKPFLQEQVTAFIDKSFNSQTFVYNQATCSRDTGLIVDSIAMDLLYNSTSDSTFAGLQYWSQDVGFTGQILNEITTTTDSIYYLNSVMIDIAAQSGASDDFITVLNDKFNILLSILNAGTTSGITDQIVPNGLPTNDDGFIVGYLGILDNKQLIINQVIDYINTNNIGFVYDTTICARDIGFIIDSTLFDALHSGNRQSIKAAVYYYGYDSNASVIPNEVPQTSAAYNFIKSIIPKIVKAELIINPYQNLTIQTIGLNAATDYEVSTLQNNIDVITNIIRNGPAFAPAKTPINLTENTSVGVANAYALLMANRDFIRAEVLAYIDSQLNNFTYNREKSFRDVGILVENISYDAAFGGNEKAVESGLAYYNGVTSVIAGKENQCIAGIDYLSQLCQKVINNDQCVDLYSNGFSTTATYSQVFNYNLINGIVASNSLNRLFNIVTNIIGNGAAAAPTVYKSTGPDAAFVSAETLLHANRAFIQQDTINWINNNFQTFPFNSITCKRDTGLILDSIAADLLYPTDNYSQSTFAGLQYWNQDGYVGTIANELSPTINAIKYLKDLSVKVIQNITPADDLVGRYQSLVPQVTNLEAATIDEATIIKSSFDIIIDIISGNNTGWTDRIISNSLVESNLLGVKNAFNLLQANKSYMAAEIIAYVNSTNPGFEGAYSEATCQRDVGFITDSVGFDLVHGGNRQSIQAGLSYYGLDGTNITIQGQELQTTDAFTHLAELVGSVVQNIVVSPMQLGIKQNVTLPSSDSATALQLQNFISAITDIISAGPSVAAEITPIAMTATSSTMVANAIEILNANKNFLIAETLQYINNTYNQGSFQYNQDLCYRDTGLIIDAVSQDILLGGNQKSVEAGLAYWNKGYNYVTGQETTTTLAISYARDLALQVIANQPVTPQTGTYLTQVINPFFQYGGDYMPQQAVRRNFDIITNIIERGPLYAPLVYAGGGLTALTGINGADVVISPRVTSISTVSTGTYLIGLSTSTIGFGNNATLYFGDVLVFPQQDTQVEALSLELTGNTSTWDSRKIDPIGAMGGSLVDGSVISSRSPIQSFVYDAFTQLTQGGRGIHVTNDGYAQLVSVFTIFCSIGVQTDNGGIASIVNSNANFGDICLLSKGYGERKFTGTIYNPPYKAYPDSPGPEGLNQYYPNGFWPNNGNVEVFLSDTNDRPHISLVMEIVPPDAYTNYAGVTGPYINEQGFSGFLNATPSLSTLATGTITITGINTEGIAVGNTVYIRDENGSEIGDNGKYYAITGTVVTDIGYQSVTLNNALESGGGNPNNSNYFTLYFCGNAYYTILSSTIADNPKPEGLNILSSDALGGAPDQVLAHIQSLMYLNTLTNNVINNVTATTYQSTVTQTVLPLVTDGGSSQSFIDLRFGELESIIAANNITDANNIIPPKLRTKTGIIPQGAGSAITLIEANLDFMAAEVTAYVIDQHPEIDGFNQIKCTRDVKIILQRLIYDLETGGRYNTVMTGLSYWSRAGTHHIVNLGENVRRTDLFPDGSTVNFYQRSYISASGYVFEYVGAGSNYGALPQVGRADPVQGKETVQLDTGKVFFTSTDQNGDFRIGPGLVISQATGVLSGRTFTKSLFANMTPFILAVEGGGI